MNGNDSSAWPPLPAEPVIGTCEVHVWRAPLALPPTRLAALWESLVDAERARATSYRFRRDQERFVASRGLLRAFLARYLGRPPCGIIICYGPHGKPTLAAGGEGESLEFSVSHTDDLALFALARGRRVGVDVERARVGGRVRALATRLFTPRETASLDGLANTDRAYAGAWTRKEAWAKALGYGLLLPFRQIEVTLAPGEPIQLLGLRGDTGVTAFWQLVELAPGPEYVATLAAEGLGWQVRCWQ